MRGSVWELTSSFAWMDNRDYDMRGRKQPVRCEGQSSSSRGVHLCLFWLWPGIYVPEIYVPEIMTGLGSGVWESRVSLWRIAVLAVG